MIKIIATLLLAIILLGIHGVARTEAETGYPADAEFTVTARDDIVLPPMDLPALPEPAVLIMMLLGVCVIGYRVRRDSDEPFR